MINLSGFPQFSSFLCSFQVSWRFTEFYPVWLSCFRLVTEIWADYAGICHVRAAFRVGGPIPADQAREICIIFRHYANESVCKCGRRPISDRPRAPLPPPRRTCKSTRTTFPSGPRSLQRKNVAQFRLNFVFAKSNRVRLLVLFLFLFGSTDERSMGRGRKWPTSSLDPVSANQRRPFRLPRIDRVMEIQFHSDPNGIEEWNRHERQNGGIRS